MLDRKSKSPLWRSPQNEIASVEFEAFSKPGKGLKQRNLKLFDHSLLSILEKDTGWLDRSDYLG
jgi:hypothetical protein